MFLIFGNYFFVSLWHFQCLKNRITLLWIKGVKTCFDLTKIPCVKCIQGPALCVYNNAKFSPEDWEGIRMLHTSIKEEDPLKVGRFGLGFKSVFHLAGNAAMVCGCLGMEIHLHVLPKTLTGIADCLKCCKFKVKP
jgi:hypothetical protein